MPGAWVQGGKMFHGAGKPTFDLSFRVFGKKISCECEFPFSHITFSLICGFNRNANGPHVAKK